MNAAHVFQNPAHSDADLRTVRAQLLSRAVQLRERLLRVQRTLRREGQDPPRDFSDAAVIDENDEIMRAIEKSSSAELARIDHALARFEEGTFALCEHCGEEIDMARLQVVPDAIECRACSVGN